MANWKYYIGPLEWDVTDPSIPHWRPPIGTSGMVDLGRGQDFSTPGSARSFGFFAVDSAVTLQSDWTLLAQGDCREIGVTGAMRSAWSGMLGYMPSGALLVDLLWDHLTTGADPDWSLAAKPLMPTVGGNLELMLGGHSRIKVERFEFGKHPATNKIAAMIQRDYQKQHDENPEQARKVLDFNLEKYRLSKTDKTQWQRLIPPRLRKGHKGPLKHATTIPDNFNRPDEPLDASADWTEVVNGLSVVSNQCQGESSSIGRNENNLSSDDMRTQCLIVNDKDDRAVLTRMSSSTTVSGPFYMLQQRSYSDICLIYKRLGGSWTLLGFVTSTENLNFTLKLTSDGSSHEGFIDGVSKVGAFTDTAITGNTLHGIRLVSPGQLIDDYEAADLSATTAVPALLEGRMFAGGMQSLSGGIA